jgi:hypothetical protein
MQFWYHMYGSGMGILNVYVNVSNTTSLVWTQNGNKGNRWNFGQISVKSGKSFRLLIEAVRGKDFRSDIAIDDIDFIEKSCDNLPDNSNPTNFITIPVITTTRSLRPTSSYDCNFETNYCIWKQSTENNFNWTRAQGKQGSQIIGLLDSDHTLGTSNGWYLTTNLANRRSSDKARIESSQITSYKCMEFRYYFFTNSKFNFNIYVKINNQLGLPIWSRSNSQADFWKRARVTITAGNYYQLVFEITNVINGVSTDKIALDDIFFSTGSCPDSSDINQVCSFSNGNTCGYNISTASSFQWKLFDPQSRFREINSDNNEIKQAKTGPILINDHTTSGSGSGYVYVESTNQNPKDKASITSQLYYPGSTNINEATKCLEFYYYLQGTNSIALNAKTVTSNSKVNPLWSRDYDHGSFWWKSESNIKLISNFSIVFEAITGTNPSGGLAALDDIGLRNGPCSSLAGTCDFDKKDLCNWANLNESDFQWILYSGSTPTDSTGPTADHTIGTNLGFYIYIETSSPTKPGWKAQLISEPFSDGNPGCLSFWFHMYGSTIGSLNVYLLSDNRKNKDIIWTLSGSTGNVWMQGLIPFQSNLSHQILFEGVAGTSYYGDIALDDLSVKRETCLYQPKIAIPQLQINTLVDCGFEKSYCNWINDTQNTQFNWTLNNGTTPSFDTGPSSGAESTDGYLYIETSYTNNGDKARIVSKSVPKPIDELKGYCLSFFYHMWGSDIGSLVLSTISSGKETTIFSKSGTNIINENKWKKALLRLNSDNYKSDFSLAFDGYSGSGYQGDIAIDQISLKVGECEASRICDFETDYCNWINDTTATNNFYWQRSKNATASSGTGPSIDHTTGSQNGYYIFIETSYPQKQGDKARLISPTYPATSGTGDCFKFWFHLNGLDIGTLNVWIRQNNQLIKNIWSRSGNLGDIWRYGHVTVKSNTEFQMVLEGIVGKSFLGDAAIDDIEITNGECYPEGFCDFEDEGFCGYYNTKEGDDFDWEKDKGQAYPTTGPSVDHTTNTDDGSYVFINPVYSHKKDDKAWLISESLSISDSPACLNWYMHLYGSNIGNLSIYQRLTSQNLLRLFNIEKQQGNKWILGQITIQPQINYFDLIFEATVGNGFFGNIALDDINLVKGGTCEYFNLTTTKPTTRTQSPPISDLDCDFESNNKFCNWYPDPSSDKLWTIQNGNSANYGSAPLTDKTTSSSQGNYAYLNTNLNIVYGSANLKSPSTTFDKESCLEFWYQLNGPVSSALTVAIRSKTNKTDLWKRKGNNADIWSHAYVRVPNNTNQWLEFEGINL